MNTEDLTTPEQYASLLAMRKRGAGWLADHLESMIHGDPYQGAECARDILDDYKKFELRMPG